jgi:hypothetical protein
MPAIEPFEPDELKLLFMALCEDRGHTVLPALIETLTPHGVRLLYSIQRKLGIMVVGVDSGRLPADPSLQ